MIREGNELDDSVSGMKMGNAVLCPPGGLASEGLLRVTQVQQLQLKGNQLTGNPAKLPHPCPRSGSPTAPRVDTSHTLPNSSPSGAYEIEAFHDKMP